MARALAQGFADIIALARTRLTSITIDEDIDVDRGILTIDGQFDHYRVFIKEVVSPRRRRYAFYILWRDRVMLGLDNHTDRHALRLRYGSDFTEHIHELIPHRHGPDKKTLELTEEWTAERFLNELDELVAALPKEDVTDDPDAG